MQTVAPEGRSVVSISSTGAVSIDVATSALQQAGAPRDSRGAADAGAVLKEILQAFDGLFSSSVQPATISQGPTLFSASVPSPADSLGGIRSTLEGISQKLSALAGGLPASVNGPSLSNSASNSAATQASADWPFPDLGSSPFMDRPTGSGPTGSFGFNPTYFPTEATAQTIARMLGGKVVPQNVMLTAPGSPFAQNQPNYMVELPNGNVINPGFIAQAIDSKQPRATIDAVIYSEVNNTPVAIGQAPRFVPVNGALPGSSTGSSTPVSTATPSSPSALPPAGWSSLDQMASHASRTVASSVTPADDETLAAQDRMRCVMKMLQLVSRLVSVQQAMQPDSLVRRPVNR